MQYKANLSDEMVTSLERAQFEYERSKDLLAYISSSSNFGPESESFEIWNKRSMDSFYNYQMEKRKIEQLVPELFGEEVARKMKRWNVDFGTKEITVES